MPTAPSFQEMPIVKEPFYDNGKMYVEVKNLKTSKIRKVRWYSATEYARAYGNKFKAEDAPDRIKNIRGFSDGPVLVCRGNEKENDAWLRKSNARYAIGMGWYFVSTEKIPDDLPKDLKLIAISWDEVKEDEKTLKSPNKIAKIIDEKAFTNKDVIIFD